MDDPGLLPPARPLPPTPTPTPTPALTVTAASSIAAQPDDCLSELCHSSRPSNDEHKLTIFLQTTKVQREEQTHGIDGLLNHGIDGLFKKSVYTVYEIKLRKHHREWSVFRRYSQFEDVCAKVQLIGQTRKRLFELGGAGRVTASARSAEFEQALHDACAEILKELPKKKLFDRLAPNVVELRRVGLQSWTRLFYEKAMAPLLRDGPLFSLAEAFLELQDHRASVAVSSHPLFGVLHGPLTPLSPLSPLSPESAESSTPSSPAVPSPVEVRRKKSAMAGVVRWLSQMADGKISEPEGHEAPAKTVDAVAAEIVRKSMHSFSSSMNDHVCLCRAYSAWRQHVRSHDCRCCIRHRAVRRVCVDRCIMLADAAAEAAAGQWAVGLHTSRSTNPMRSKSRRAQRRAGMAACGRPQTRRRRCSKRYCCEASGRCRRGGRNRPCASLSWTMRCAPLLPHLPHSMTRFPETRRARW